MNHKKISTGGRLRSVLFRLVIILVVLFNSLVVGITFKSEPVKAASYSGELTDVDDPPLNTTGEFGIWVDRARIYLYWSSEDWSESLPSHGFHAPSENGLNDGNIEYTNDGQDCLKLNVNFSSNNASPSSGTLERCDGTTTRVSLLHSGNAKLDGYSYEESGENKMFMPRYIGGVQGCGDITGRTGDYRNDGTFTEDGDQYSLSSPDSDDQTYINNIANSGDRLKTAKQHRFSRYQIGGVTTENCTLSYAGDGADGGRTIYMLRGFSRIDVKRAIENRVRAYQSQRGRVVLLTDYFANSAEGRAALQTCQEGTGTSGSQAALIRILVDNQPGTNPFVDCMLRELEGDPDFETALDYEYDGNFDENLISDSEGDCGDGGIPIISDLACWLVGWVFDALHAGFSAVIDYLAAPPDMFEQQNSTLEQSMKNLRNVANLIFVLAFLFVVFQYLTNINVVDAYFVKKFVPRLVVAVVLVQASFFIVSELNYFFYDLGKSVQTIVFQGNNIGDLVVNNGAATLALAAGVTLGPALIGILLVIGFILLLVLLITMIVLAIRYILIIVLAILAPIAFAALAIPQLEGMTKKWFNMYIKLLLMYPIIMFFLAASAVVGGSLSGGGIILQVLGLIAAFLPFIILPFTFKFAGGLMGTVSAKLMKAPMKGYKAYKKGEGLYETKTQAGRARAERKKVMEQNKADRARRAGTADATERMNAARNRRGLRGWASQRRVFGGGATDVDMDRQTSLREEALRRQDLEDAKLRFEHSQHDVSTSTVRGAGGVVVGRTATGAVDTDDIYNRLARGEQLTVEAADGTTRVLGGNDADAEMAMNQLASYGRDVAIRGLASDPTVNQAALQRAINGNASALSGKAPDIVKGPAAAFSGGMSAPALSGFSAGTIDELFTHHIADPTINSSVMSALDALVHGPDSKPLSDMSRGTAERLVHHLNGIPGVDPAIIAALQAKL